ncbi:MAG: sigma-70 family RNA polymerase sigma factor [Oscillospiraceae bacterium]|nr:sigma-70 family RNA polymerase sigma factor [Oscillospiraceae bacterium]
MDKTKDQNNQEVSNRVAGENPYAEETLVAEYSWLVRACARPYFLAGGDSEDLIQEGMLGLLSAIRSYNPDKGAKFSTYAEFCIRRRIYSAIKSASAGKHTPLNSYISLESPQIDESSTPNVYSVRSPEDFVIAREHIGEVEKLLYGALSGFESRVLELFLEGMSYKNMAEHLSKPEKSIDNAVQRIRKKLSHILIRSES